MSKDTKFSIHDWQAKQRQQLLTEEDEWQKRQDALTPGKNPEKFYGDLDKLRGSMAANELSPDEVMTVYNNFMDTHKYKETVIDDPDGDKENATLKIDTEDGKSYEVLTSAVGDEKWWEWGSGPYSSDQAEYDKGWYGESLKELASKLGYLNEAEYGKYFGGRTRGERKEYEKASFVYTEQGGRFYSLTLSTSDGQTLKMKYDEANEWVKKQLEYIHEGDLIPRRYNSGLEDLDLIVARLKELGIEASHGDYMDVS